METTYKKIPVNKIKPDPNQPRRSVDLVSIAEMADSIKKHGVINAIEVEPTHGGYQIITGEIRWKAAKKTGAREIDCRVIEGLSKDEKKLRQLVENLQRSDMAPNYIAECLDQLLKKGQSLFKNSVALANALGKDPSWVTKMLRILDLPLEIQRKIEKHKTNERTASALSSVNKLEMGGMVKSGTLNKFSKKFFNGELSHGSAREIATAINDNPGLAGQLLAVNLSGKSQTEAREELEKIALTKQAQLANNQYVADKILKLAHDLTDYLRTCPARKFGLKASSIALALVQLERESSRWIREAKRG